jgi:hypothetical protein
LRKIRIEFVLVIAVLVVTIVADTVELLESWKWVSAIKIAAAIVGLVITYQQLSRSRPYFKDLLKPSDWQSIGTGQFEVWVPQKEHKRGDTPHVRCLVPDGSSWAECFTDAQVDHQGNVRVGVTSPDTMRIEIRA